MKKKSKMLMSIVFMFCEILYVGQIPEVYASPNTNISADKISDTDVNSFIILKDDIKDLNETERIIFSCIDSHWTEIEKKLATYSSEGFSELDIDKFLMLLRIIYINYIENNLFSMEKTRKYLLLKRYKVIYYEKQHNKIDSILYKFLCGFFDYIKYNKEDKEKVKEASGRIKKNLSFLPEKFKENIENIFKTVRIRCISN